MDPRVAGRVTKDMDCLGAGREGRARGGTALETPWLAPWGLMLPELPILDRPLDGILISTRSETVLHISATGLSTSSSIGLLKVI